MYFENTEQYDFRLYFCIRAINDLGVMGGSLTELNTGVWPLAVTAEQGSEVTCCDG